MTRSMNNQLLSKHKIKRDNLFDNKTAEEKRKMLEDRFKNDSNYADLRVKIGVKQENQNQNAESTQDGSLMPEIISDNHWGEIDRHAYILHLETQKKEKEDQIKKRNLVRETLQK